MEATLAPSRISVPPRAHVLVRALYSRMAELGVGYKRMAAESGVKVSTFKAWRSRNSITPPTIQATLRVVGLRALPCPDVKVLPAPLTAELTVIGERHGVRLPIAELVVLAASQPRDSGSC